MTGIRNEGIRFAAAVSVRDRSIQEQRGQDALEFQPTGRNVKLAYITEVAAIMASHGHLFIEQADDISCGTISEYYVLSRNRFNRWMRALDDIEHFRQVSAPLSLVEAFAARSAACNVMQQILINEMAVRIWTVLLLARDESNSTERIRPVARNIYLGHLSVRHKALRVMLSDDRVTRNDLMSIDRLRKSIERWTDLLCSPVMGQFNLWEYAFNKERALEFLRDRGDGFHHRSRAWVLILAGLRHSFHSLPGLTAPIHDDDRQLVRMMLNSFPQAAPEMAFWIGPGERETKPC